MVLGTCQKNKTRDIYTVERNRIENSQKRRKLEERKAKKTLGEFDCRCALGTLCFRWFQSRENLRDEMVTE